MPLHGFIALVIVIVMQRIKTAMPTNILYTPTPKILYSLKFEQLLSVHFPYYCSTAYQQHRSLYEHNQLP